MKQVKTVNTLKTSEKGQIYDRSQPEHCSCQHTSCVQAAGKDSIEWRCREKGKVRGDKKEEKPGKMLSVLCERNGPENQDRLQQEHYADLCYILYRTESF